MRYKKKSGFTMTELIVVLAIIGILAAIAIPTAIHYIRLAQFRANEENAKSVYLGAETTMTYYRSSGQWEEFCREVQEQGTLNQSFSETDQEYRRIYGITMDPGTYGTDPDNLVYRLLNRISYDKDFLEEAIGIELDIETGEVYSAFYATKCKGLYYKDEEAQEGRLDLYDRDDEKSRRQRLLGKYCVDDMVDPVDLSSRRLKVTSVSLVNGETLALNWSGNSRHYNLDVAYEIRFLEASKDEELFRVNVDLSKLYFQFPAADSEEAERMLQGGEAKELYAQLEVTFPRAGGADIKKTFAFPITVKNGEIALTLDAMMSAELTELLTAKEGMTQEQTDQLESLRQTSSTSITRLQRLAPALKTSPDIYAVITASSNNQYAEEYKKSNASVSNKANAMYGDGAWWDGETLKAGIRTFRHLSNIRYVDSLEKEGSGSPKEGSVSAEFAMKGGTMDWNAVGTGLYTLKPTQGGEVQQPVWTARTDDGQVAFPTVPRLAENQTLEGVGKASVIANLYLDQTSVTGEDAKYLGLFGEAEGTLREFSFLNPSLSYEEKSGTEDPGLFGVGLLAGKSTGGLKNIAVEAEQALAPTLLVQLKGEGSGSFGIGGLVGVLEIPAAGSGENQDQAIEGLVMSGRVEGAIGEGVQTEPNGMRGAGLGIGGVAGYVDFTRGGRLVDCENYADVYGNGCTGGIAGRMKGRYSAEEQSPEEGAAPEAELVTCVNEGLVLQEKEGNGTPQKEARYFGGILGFGEQVKMDGCTSTPGASSDYIYSLDKKDRLLRGWYVGGILGFGKQCMLQSCSTGRDGYVLGNRYVGGIVGALHGKESDIPDTTIQGGANATVNASYVIGNDYVGGIVGENRQNQVLRCVNNGIAVGYGAYIGGITGANTEGSQIVSCTSYISDYDGSVYDRIVSDWQAGGSFVGGLAGYNNGEIIFDKEMSGLDTQSVFSIVAGKDYVGGVVGFQDVKGSLKVDYVLMGGRIYASGDCAGGLIGLNASRELLTGDSGSLLGDFEVRPGSVAGRYCVGGGIGANVVYLSEEDSVTLEKIYINNTLGAVTGEAFCGGLIGYQRNAGLLDADGRPTELLTFLTDENGRPKAGQKEKLVQSLNSDGLPVRLNAEGTALTLGRGELWVGPKKAPSPMVANNMPVFGEAYVGGIVGYAEVGSSLTIQNCSNLGALSKKSGKESKVRLQELLDFIISDQDPDKAQILSGAPNPAMDVAGGIISVCLKGQTISDCQNYGTMNGFDGIGGVVGLNAGTVMFCNLTGNFGNLELSYVGGIASFNLGLLDGNRLEEGCIVSGKDAVGGITACNLYTGVLQYNESKGSVTADGDGAGGTAAWNAGSIYISVDSGSERGVTSQNGVNVGGVLGENGKTGVLLVKSPTGTQKEVVVVGPSVTVEGQDCVGGIIGRNSGSIRTEKNVFYITAQAHRVHAYNGSAGGVAGESEGNLTNVRNKSGMVLADKGNAGGIVAVNGAGSILKGCENYGTVRNSQGYAGGICARNEGILENCLVSGVTSPLEIYSLQAEGSGAICGWNVRRGAVQGTIRSCGIEGQITLGGDGTVFGAIAGRNEGRIRDIAISQGPKVSFPEITTSGKGLTVGGVAGSNTGTIEKSEIKMDFKSFEDYRYLGGIAGENLLKSGEDDAEVRGRIEDCTYQGTIQDAGSSGGSCYGGIAGRNEGSLSKCEIDRINMKIQGVYTATSTSTAKEKERLSTHVGGIAGMNEEKGIISQCYLKGDPDSSFSVDYGMVGGVAGYNKGLITYSGDVITETVMTEEITGVALPKPGEEDVPKQREKKSLSLLLAQEAVRNMKVDDAWVRWDNTGKGNIEALSYDKQGGGGVTDNRMQMKVCNNGNLGGITAFNVGSVSCCVTGDWFLNNKSLALGVGTGGIIGMNESEADQRYLVNQAFVGRWMEEATTNRFAGGIIGNQNNSTAQGWTIEKCLNYGTVYCYNAHYSGGIIGQWTGTGGTVESCVNYGNLQTTCMEGWVGASGGIVAQLYHANENNEYNIVSCGNYGSLYGQRGRDTGIAANDSGGILGNVTNYYVDDPKNGQSYTIRVLDCVNGPGVEIYSGSLAAGIVSFLSCDREQEEVSVGNSTANTRLVIERCRNFAANLQAPNHVGGIFGDRYVSRDENTTQRSAKNTVIQDCFSVNASAYNIKKRPIVSLIRGGVSTSTAAGSGMQTGRNYFFESGITYTGNRTPNANDNSFPNLALYESNRTGTGGNTRSERRITNDTDPNRADAHRVYRVQDLDASPRIYLAVALREGETLNSSCWIDRAAKEIRDRNGNTVGDIICELDNNSYGTVEGITGKGASWCDLVHTSYLYRNMEGWEEKKDAGGNPVKDENGNPILKLAEPEKVTAALEKDGISLTIDNGGRDPLRYEVEVAVGQGEQRKIQYSYLYGETGSVSLPESTTGGQIEIRVRAVSMYDQVEPSAWISAGNLEQKIVLPTPEIQAELIWDREADNGKGDYRYQVSLANLDKYPMENLWEVRGQLSDGTPVALSRDNPSIRMEGKGEKYITTEEGRKLAAQTVLQMVLQAEVKAGFEDQYLPSAKSSVSMLLPKYTPVAALDIDDVTKVVKPSLKVSGTSLEDLSLEVTLDGAGTGSLDYPPVYRAELIGNYTAPDKTVTRDVVFAYTDILVAPGGSASALLNNYGSHSKEDLKYGSDFQVRVWYAESGLGRVYTYFDLNAGTNGGAPAVGEGTTVLTYLDQTDAAGQPTFAYLGTPVWSRNEFKSYRSTFGAGETFTLLAEPVLADRKEALNGRGDLSYTFAWDEGVAAGQRYRVALTGITKNGDSVTIDTTGAYTDAAAHTMTISADSWNFTRVELAVTPVGNSASKNPTIGVTARRTYSVRQHLPQPSQPSVTLVDTNELDYLVQWTAPVNLPADCDRYEVYWRDGENGNVLLGEAARKADGTTAYSLEVDLEQVQKDGQPILPGKTGEVYVVAKADTASTEYVDSKAGVAFGLTVPNRIQRPVVTWDVAWPGEATLETFEKDGLPVKLYPDNNSKPSAGSAYVLKAEIYDMIDGAEVRLGVYPKGTAGLDMNRVTPLQMTYNGSTGAYSLNLSGLSAEYAGKKIRLYARISSGEGQVSSDWTTVEATLPALRLDAPEVSSRSYDQEVTASILRKDDGTQIRTENWTVRRNQWLWGEVPYGDAYDIIVTKRDNTTLQLRVERIANSSGQPAIRLLQKKGGAWEELAPWQEGTWLLDDRDYGYQQIVEADYTGSAIAIGRVTLSLELRAEYYEDTGGFTFALTLPDMESLYDLQQTLMKENQYVTATVTLRSDRQQSGSYLPSADKEIQISP